VQKPLHYFSILFFLIILFISCNTSPKNYYTGLKVYKNFDSTRKFDTTSTDKAPFYFRPVKIDLFYPSAENAGREPMTYGDILDMYEQRMNYNNPPDSCKKVSADLAKAFAEYLHVDSASKLLSYKTGIYSDLELPADKHSLIIYAAGMNGSSWENEILFDSLAKAGYVVAAISSVGKYPGYMSSAPDLDEQVQDILYAKKIVSQLSFIDSSRIGLLSWSLGGSAITKAAMLSNDFKCLLSFDGTEIHHYGSDTAWDKEFNEIMAIAPNDPGTIHIPYMYLSSEHPKNIDSVYNLQEHTNSKEKYFLQFNGGTHEDFSSIITSAKNAAPKLGNIDSGRNEIICRLTLNFFNQYIGQKNSIPVSEYIDKLVAEKPRNFSTAYPKK
jgi:hypothetical protein